MAGSRTTNIRIKKKRIGNTCYSKWGVCKAVSGYKQFCFSFIILLMDFENTEKLALRIRTAAIFKLYSQTEIAEKLLKKAERDSNFSYF